MDKAISEGEAAGRNEKGQDDLVRTVMRRQSRLALAIAAVFVLVLVGLPLLNLYLPEVMAMHVGGFTLTWLLLGVLFYPVTWLLSWLFVRGSDRIEARIVQELRAPRPVAVASPAIEEAPAPSEASAKRKLFVEDDEA